MVDVKKEAFRSDDLKKNKASNKPDAHRPRTTPSDFKRYAKKNRKIANA